MVQLAPMRLRLLVYNREMQAQYGISQESFKGYCSICGPVSLAHCQNRTISRMLSDLLPPDGERTAADPYAMVRGDEGIPVLCLHGRHDPLVEIANAEAFAERVGNQHAQLHIEEGRNVYHSNLSIDAFLGGISSTDVLHSWLMGITRGKQVESEQRIAEKRD